ncbi:MULTISPECIES: DUF5983 family protein [Alcaligenaceae]|uniref:DUF5983 domain-containing protein n=1 Tax=Eoetvoesiella caeni TaxID=645616 RepID=A0A366H837_9BURK|nr:ABC transporter substrate-binding protein [Eoetvoesiella caeni]MCI2810292.1 ABC transporter substrate-binding protein [Eoetvoesiella caeni]NYT54661.1 ABC transporter substrate-binding protein [Eoetvoesiella caeni]RBP37172.1 hypothetical protein DFR37_110127 [Eoetvoesiella caeni]
MVRKYNPFLRGYRNLRAIRTLLITYEDDSPPVWRPLHSSQTSLPDEQVARFPCIWNEDFALITEGQDVRGELQAQCSTEGVVRSVVYALEGEDIDGRPVLVADTYSKASAQEAIHRLNFETGFYSRCWEISGAHITEQAHQYLADLADQTTPQGLQFVAFRMPDSSAIGVKLIATPWTDENLEAVLGITAQQLRREHRSKGMPYDLANVLELAGQADVRILIVDADAPVLLGLPLAKF